jgi:hypothetical protein
MTNPLEAERVQGGSSFAAGEQDDGAPSLRTSHMWRVRYPLGTVDAVRSMGTIAAPLLAGFALTTVVLLATASSPPRFADWALAALAAAAGLFVFSLQFTLAGLLYAAPPSDRMAWRPDAATNRGARDALRRVQRKDDYLQREYFRRARGCYDLGMLGYLVGLLVIIYPVHWTVGRAIALGVVALAAVLELVWMVAAWSGKRPAWLLPGYANVPQAALDDVEASPP